MKLYKRHMDRKGIGSLLRDFVELEDGPADQLAPSWFLICHGLTAFMDEVCAKRGLSDPGRFKAAGGRALVLSTDPEDGNVQASLTPLAQNGVVRGLAWGLDARAEGQQDRWKTTLLGAFLDGVRQLGSWDNGEPPWDLLLRPRAPEGLLACYLLLSIGRELQESWKTAATTEYEAYRKAEPWPPLEFSAPKLAEILRRAGGLGETVEATGTTP